MFLFQVEREGEVFGGLGILSIFVGDGIFRDLQSLVELWYWIQEVLGDV